MTDSAPKILIVDDEEGILKALDRILTREGYEVYTTVNPLNAIEIVRKNSIDLVISDIMMAELSGLDLLTRIKSINPFIPVVLITGNPNLSTAREAIQSQAFDYIPKPVERQKILEVTRKGIEAKRKQERDLEEKEASKSIAESLVRKNKDLNLQNTIILDTTKDYVITILKDGTIHSLNKSAREKFEPVGSFLIGQNISVLFPEHRKEIYNRLFRVVVHYKKISNRHKLQADLVDKDGNSITTEVSFCSYRIDEEEFFTGIFRDHSERKILTQRLIESEKRAFLTTIAASIGHEINNALTAIMGYVELASRPDSTEELKEKAIQVTFDQVNKLRNLASNLLTLGRKKETWMESESSTTDLNQALRRVLEVFEKSKRLKNCRLHLSMDPEPLYVIGSQDKLELVISNLVLNAADATQNCGDIHISTFKRNEEPYFEISDNGIGMSEEVQSRIFEPYFTTKEMGKGTGLGMFVVKEIAQMYGIRIRIESKENEGSKISLHLKNAAKNQ